MRKLSLLFALCLMLLVCFVACKEDKSADNSVETQQTTQATQTTESPTDEESTKEPETPQYQWTGRY